MLCDIMERFPNLEIANAAISGSAGIGIANTYALTLVQEVHATKICTKHYLPEADAVIELGGEDAKILFLSGMPDARMNGSCAGGTSVLHAR